MSGDSAPEIDLDSGHGGARPDRHRSRDRRRARAPDGLELAGDQRGGGHHGRRQRSRGAGDGQRLPPTRTAQADAAPRDRRGRRRAARAPPPHRPALPRRGRSRRPPGLARDREAAARARRGERDRRTRAAVAAAADARRARAADQPRADAQSDADAVSLIGRIVAMGGAVDVPGNITPTAEFNMYVDPEAAHRVFAARLPLDLVPLDATRQAVLPRAGLKSALRRESGPLVDRIVAFSERGFRLDHSTGAQGLVLHDPLALALAIDPTLAEWEPVRLVVGPDGETLRASGEPNCRIARRVDTDRFLRLFLERLCPPAPRRPASS